MQSVQTFAWMRKNHQKIRYFGLGFIEVKICNDTRMHFYTPKLPQIISEEYIHNHRYAFASRVVSGLLSQEIFQITAGDSHIIEQEDRNPHQAVVEVTNDTLVGVDLVSRHTYAQGSDYFLRPQVFHRVKADECVTYVTRYGSHRDFADVVRPVGSIKVCPSNQAIEEDRLWEIVEMMMKCLL